MSEFEEGAESSVAARLEDEALIVDVDGFEGPLDLLLTLSRRQKVDLRRISVLQLSEQYLRFVEAARALRIELAADYLVMAAWLAFLKSRLLLPPDPGEEGPSAEDLAAHLAFQLERLEAMREAAGRLMGRDRLGREFFARGAPETQAIEKRTQHTASLLDLIQAYARIRTKDEFRPYAFDRTDIYPLETALERLRGMIGHAVDWSDLAGFLPPGWRAAGARRRSALASTFAASLELAKQGQLDLRQSETFAPIRLRLRPNEAR
ncbi:MAG: segregation/condensation protein A [Rhodobacter sp.]|uniref:segregation and condensation protein A n=1 Tax=Pararhodobacter sp. TaxID=2127056 RepID=UPI001DD5C10B|nr:ScpA family protein [Pararhodobacter sp.]MCB1345240.1 segregation/condensation protein A [Paracoccaceae bacterium]MCC0074853.1 segregation/condensation protein A [Rhodobacter sp.]HPD90853.1 ScpA family protein [Pararhodobacter sp.]